jgi:hypothetical protein
VSYFASVNGLQVVGGALLIPLVGTWTADLVLATAGPLALGPAMVVIGNLTLQGTVYRANAYGGQMKARLVGGAGGWRQVVPPQGYGNPGGVSLSTVLGDVAAACGESIVIADDVNVGPAYVRLAGVASDVLWQLTRQALIPSWRVDVDGATKTDAWPATVIGTPFTPTAQRPDEGIVEIATEDYASWLPGCTFSSPLLDATYTSAGVAYVWDNEGTFRFEVLTTALAPAGDRVLGPIQQLVESRVAPTRFYGRYEYTISNPTPNTVDGTPTDTSIGLPDVQNVPIRTSSLATYTPPAGGLCEIQFTNGQPTRPVCVWTEADPAAGPSEVTIVPQGKGANGVARVSDTVTIIMPPVMQIAGVVNATMPFVGVLTITTPGIGTISTGSSVVKAAQST